jgi:hypothetical protein
MLAELGEQPDNQCYICICASDCSEAGWLGKLLPQRLACASDGGTSRPVKLLLQ